MLGHEKSVETSLEHKAWKWVLPAEDRRDPNILRMFYSFISE